MLLQSGAQLGPYQILALIGEGGMGEVYRAQDTRLGRDVAIKIVTTVVSRDPEQLQRFAQEARAAGMLNHPNLITIFDIGTANGMPYIVSELLEGETLRDRMGHGPMPIRRAMEYSDQIASGLAAAHEKGIVHRDLKPENIFITRDDRVKILDFGIAKLNLPSSGEGPTFKMAATEPGMVLGTVGYMSPEQVRGENVDQRSDIFSFGAILYEMLAGSRAFRRDSSIETLSAILKEEPRDLVDMLPSLPPPVDKLVRRCLEKDRTRRFQSARDLAFHLETLLHASTGASASLSHAVEPTDRVAAQPPTPPRTTPPPSTAANRQVPRPTTPNTAQPALPVRPRPAGPAPIKKAPRVSKALLWVFFIVAVSGAGIGGFALARRLQKNHADIQFHRVTFRRGEIRAARFAPDGDTIVYSAAWEGAPMELFVANRRSPEARPLGVNDAEICAISKATELAVLMHRDRLSGLGRLARVPLAGGTPREIADNVLSADWSPDGSKLAAIRLVQGKYRVEYPLGKVLYETVHVLRELRISPNGEKIAFIEPTVGANDLVIIDHGSVSPLLHGYSHGAVGLAWTADSKEIWFTGADTAEPPALFAVTMDGETRLISRLTGAMRLFDLSAEGRALLIHSNWRAALLHQAPGELREHDVSWLDWSILSDLSPDGRTLVFNETREGGGEVGSVYLRRPDAATPIRIGDGYGDAISPDGQWILSHNGPKLMLVPTGAGEPRELKVDGAFDLGGVFLPDGRHVLVAGAMSKDQYGLVSIDVTTGEAKRVTKQPIWGDAFRPFAVSPDGLSVVGIASDARATIFAMDGGPARAVPGVERGEVPLCWSADGLALYVYRPTALPLRIIRVDLATGSRELWKEIAPADPAGVYRIGPIVMTRDGSAFAYDILRNLSDLYVIDGLG